jgi:hypothetical protein
MADRNCVSHKSIARRTTLANHGERGGVDKTDGCAVDSDMDLEADRLVLRKPRLSHGAELLRFLGDAKAMQFTFRLVDLAAIRRHIAGHQC